ncbi:MAG: acyl-CoA dehydrogenase N-terminal domain-containing protein, partial [Desulfobacterales bacterium]|nr:acyl-CoA dehydrogenase N-terminal domain-containing protein [Desulfobacterales bacterium]
MTQVITDRRDIEFVIHEQLEAETLSKLHENFADFNKKTIDLVISEAKNFAVKELLPTN